MQVSHGENPERIARWHARFLWHRTSAGRCIQGRGIRPGFSVADQRLPACL